MDNQSHNNHTQQISPSQPINHGEEERIIFAEFLSIAHPTDQDKQTIINHLKQKLSLREQNVEIYPLIIDVLELISSIHSITDTDFLLMMLCYQFKANQSFQQKQYELTIQHIINYIDCIDKLTNPSVQEQIDKGIALCKIGWLHGMLSENDTATAFYQQGLETCLEINAVDDHTKRQKAELLYKLEENLSKDAVILEEKPIFHNALSAYHAIEVKSVKDNHRIIQIYYQRGVFDNERGQLTQALDNLNLALEIYRLTESTNIQNKVKCYDIFYSLGIVASRLQDHESAIEFFQLAIENINEPLDVSPDLYPFTIYIYNMLGEAFIQAERYDEARSSFNQSEQLLNAMSKNEGDTNALRLLVDVNQGVMKILEKEEWEALNKFHEAETLFHEMVNKLSHNHILPSSNLRPMLTLYLRQSQIYQKQGRFDDSQASLVKLKSIYSQISTPTIEDKFYLYKALQQNTLELIKQNDIETAMSEFAQLTGLYTLLDPKTEQTKRYFIQFCTRLNLELRSMGHLEEAKEALFVGIAVHKTLAMHTVHDQHLHLIMTNRLGRLYCAQGDYNVGISHLKSAHELGQQISEQTDDVRRSILTNLKQLQLIYFELNLLPFAEKTIIQYVKHLKLLQSPTELEQAQIYFYTSYEHLISENYSNMYASFKDGVEHLSRRAALLDDETCHNIYAHNLILMMEVMQYALCVHQTSFKDYLPSFYLLLDFIGDMEYQLSFDNYRTFSLLMKDLTVIYYAGTTNNHITKTMAKWFEEDARLDLISIKAQQLSTNSINDLNTEVSGILYRVLRILKNHQVNHPAGDAIRLDDHSLEIINHVIETLRHHTQGIQSLQQKITPLVLLNLSEENKALKEKIHEQSEDIASLKELLAQQGAAIKALQDQLASSSSNTEEQSVPCSPAFFR